MIARARAWRGSCARGRARAVSGESECVLGARVEGSRALARARALSRARASALSARARRRRGICGAWGGLGGGDVAMSRGREGGGRARRRARGVSLGESALLRSPRLGAGPRDFLQVGGKRGRHIDTSRYHYVCLRLRFHSNLFRYSVHHKRIARILRAGVVACAQKGCLAICTLRYT